MCDIILFDLDGTLTDPKLGITNCVSYALRSFGIFEDDMNKLLSFIGPPLKPAFMEKYNMTEDEADAAVSKYRERFSTIGLYENEVFPGTEPLLVKLKNAGKTLVVATAKPYIYAKEILRHFDILKYFDEVLGPDLSDLHCEKSEIISRAVALFGKESKPRMVMVGDREMDILGAKENGVKSVGVRFGYAKQNELEEAGADYIASTMEDLEKILFSL